MDKQCILLLLTLASTILARPQDDDYDLRDPCSQCFEDQTVIDFEGPPFNLDTTIIEENLRYT